MSICKCSLGFLSVILASKEGKLQNDCVSWVWSSIWSTKHWSEPLPRLGLGTAAPKTWASSQQKLLPLTGSSPCTTSSRKTQKPSFALWGCPLLPTPDWPADGPSPAPCAAPTLRPLVTTLQPEIPAWSFLIDFSLWLRFLSIWTFIFYRHSLWRRHCFCC